MEVCLQTRYKGHLGLGDWESIEVLGTCHRQSNTCTGDVLEIGTQPLLQPSLFDATGDDDIALAPRIN